MKDIVCANCGEPFPENAASQVVKGVAQPIACLRCGQTAWRDRAGALDSPQWTIGSAPVAATSSSQYTPRAGGSNERLGCAFWFLVVVFTPAALVWAFLLPKEHPQRSMAVSVSSVLTLVSVLLCIVLVMVLIAMLRFMPSGLDLGI